MFSFLQNHPFAVEAYFKSSFVFTFAFPKESLAHLIPECLELDTYDDKWAFIAAAMVQTQDLRPKGFPKILGNDFFLIGYRVFVRYTDKRGKRLRGLYILKSETDKMKMEILGNIFSHYSYTTTDIYQSKLNGILEIASKRSGFSVRIAESGSEEFPLPVESPFPDWKEARKYSGPLPFTFHYKPADRKVLIVEGVRENWKPEPVMVIEHNFSFLHEMQLGNGILANAFVIRDIPYWWKKGKTEQWRKKEENFKVF
ncbi:MAG TPA: DUF2071 domain-containing protein [Puia sp.]|jgi:hypothetical protein|nr:DUF2071 domain-containing protein [Puia sp.]